MSNERSQELWLTVAIVFLAALIFVIDALFDQGIAVGVAYVSVILLAFRSDRRRLVGIVAGGCSTLVIVGMFVSPPGGEIWKVLTNGGLSLFAIWVAAFICWARQAEKQKTDGLNRSLENQSRRLQHSLAELESVREQQEHKAHALLSVVEDLHAERKRLAAEIAERRRVEEALSRDRALLEAIHRAQTRFITAEDPLGGFDDILRSLRAMTGSEYGFIDEMFHAPDGQPYLTARAITDISWNDESRKMYKQFVGGTLNFTNLHSLFGAVMTTGKPVIANDAPDDPRRCGIPPGHPPLKAFLGLPLHSSSKELVGVIGLANRPGGYSEELIPYLEPMVAACANLIAARKNDQRRRQAEQDLNRARDELELRIQERTAELAKSNQTLLAEIGERERAVEKSKINERRLNLVIDSAEMGCWELDLTNDQAWRSFRHDRIFGYDSLLPAWGYEIFMNHVVPADRDHVQKTFAAALATDSFQMECRIQWPDKSQHWVAARGCVHRNDWGEPIRMMGVIMNIDARKQMEEALAKQTAELARSNTDLEQFAYIASHDLQEPLRKIQAFGDLLATESGQALDEQGRLYVARMQNGARRMQRLINDLLSFARVTSQAKSFVEVDLAQVAHEVVSDLEGRLKTTGGRVEIGELPRLESDPTQVRQLLQNLIGNALKFHRPDVPPAVVLRSRLVPNGDPFVREHSPAELVCEIVVEDNGIGFEEKYLERIFAPFQRLHGHEQYEGTGMGLAICRKIVKRHGGTITARSTPGQGTTFLVTLPLRQPKGEQRHA